MLIRACFVGWNSLVSERLKSFNVIQCELIFSGLSVEKVQCNFVFYSL